MKTRLSLLLFLLMTFGCVDRVFFDIPIPDKFSISIGGFISDNPGPYQVSVFRTFDIESNETYRTGVSATSVMMSDNEGNNETLTQISPGIYQTSADGIRGKAGGIYKIKVELPDGRVYESIPDTLRAGGVIDKAYYQLVSHYTLNGVQYLFDIYSDATTGSDNTTHFMWTTRTTHKAKTRPEDEPFDPMKGGNCYRNELEGICNYKDPCSGLKNVGSNFRPVIERVKECECCFCWYDRYNDFVILNDKAVSLGNKYNAVRTDRVPLTGWLLKYKMRVEITLQSLSPQSYEFWKNVRDQRTAVTNIFQPVTGRIRGNIVQTTGVNEPAEGLFYATSMDRKEFYVYRGEVREDIIPSTNFEHSDDFSCLKLEPNSTNVKPSFWIE